MSDTVIGALIGVGGAVAGVIVASAFNFAALLLNRRFAVADREADQREWYRKALFEKRLAAAGEGYSWVLKLGDAIATANLGAPESSDNKTLLALAKEAREWYNRNAVLLGRNELPGSSEFIGLTNSAWNYACGKATGDIWSLHHEALDALRKRANELLETGQQNQSAGRDDR